MISIPPSVLQRGAQSFATLVDAHGWPLVVVFVLCVMALTWLLLWLL